MGEVLEDADKHATFPPRAAAALNNSWVVAVLGKDRLDAHPARQIQILLVQFDAEARVEGALYHALAMNFEDP